MKRLLIFTDYPDTVSHILLKKGLVRGSITTTEPWHGQICLEIAYYDTSLSKALDMWFKSAAGCCLVDHHKLLDYPEDPCEEPERITR